LFRNAWRFSSRVAWLGAVKGLGPYKSFSGVKVSCKIIMFNKINTWSQGTALMNSRLCEERLLAAAHGLPQGNDFIWHGRIIMWKEPATWMPAVTAWLIPHLRSDAMRRLKPGVFRNICWDDTDWLVVLSRCIKGSVESRIDELADALLAGSIRTYHGCRTDDAGSYFRNGLLVHRKGRLKAQALAIIEAHPELHHMKGNLDEVIAEINNTIDEGRCYVVVSDEGLLKDGGHFLIHGSEWIMSLFDERGRAVLRNIGAPTLIEISLPFSVTHSDDRRGVAKEMLMEWTRVACNGRDWVAPISHSFWLIKDVPPSNIVGHSHPAVINDPHDGGRIYRSPTTTCKYCAQNSKG
jgi:hypothetical protein